MKRVLVFGNGKMTGTLVVDEDSFSPIGQINYISTTIDYKSKKINGHIMFEDDRLEKVEVAYIDIDLTKDDLYCIKRADNYKRWRVKKKVFH